MLKGIPSLDSRSGLGDAEKWLVESKRLRRSSDEHVICERAPAWKTGSAHENVGVQIHISVKHWHKLSSSNRSTSISEVINRC